MLMPTIAPLSVWCGPDFFPKDVVAAMDAHGAPSMLISTPLHLRALTTAAAPEEPVALVVCATAPLEAVLVEAIERRLRTQVLEIYGCSEVGSLAWRLPAQEAAWHFFDCFGVAFEAGSIAISHSELPEPVPLADMFAAADGGGWLLQGRSTDIVKVGGKRESLANLNTLLVSTDGVVDGVFYEPETFGLPATGRLGAIVVAPGLDAREVRARLASQLDPLFLPRPLHLVDALPRDTTSKLKQAALRTMIVQLHA